MRDQVDQIREEQDEREAKQFSADISRIIHSSGIPQEHWPAVVKVVQTALRWGLSKGGNIVAEEHGLRRGSDASRN